MDEQNIEIQNDFSAVEGAPFHLSDEEIKDIIAAMRSQDSDIIHSIIKELSTSEAADLLAKISDEDRQEFLSMYGADLDPNVFVELDSELCRICLSALPSEQVAGIISALQSDDALDLITNLEEDKQNEIIRKLSAKVRLAVEEGLSFPEESAGRLMQREFIAVPQFWTVGKVIDYLRAASEDLPDDFFDIFVISPAYHVTGQIPLGRLVRAERAEKIETLIAEEIHPVPAEMDQEEVAHLFRRDNITSAPVIDNDNRLIGVITIDDVVDVIDEEAEEDILKLAGVDQGDLYRAVMSTTGTRFRWLFLNLLTAILASIVISLFNATIEETVALAVLMPIVASMGGNAGTQTLTVAVRALATKELSGANAWRILWKETLVGSLNGIAFALIAGLVAALWFSSHMLGVIIALAMIVNLFVAGFCGAGIPVLLDKIGSDPAVSSTVFLTTVTDIVGFFTFLGLAAILLI